ncbi:MAG: hypothetical protein ABI723_12515 [Bacteroidia bacterium]
MNATVFKNYWSAFFIVIINFILICFAVDFNLNINNSLRFNNLDAYAEINYLLYFLISTLMLLFFNGVLLLLKNIALLNITLKIIVTMIILLPVCALLLSMVLVFNGHYTALTGSSVYIPGIFLLISAMMVYRLVQIYFYPRAK